jgi:hypothetical protein
MKPFIGTLLCSIIFASCFNTIKKQQVLADQVSKAFGTKEVKVFQGVATGDNGTYPFIEVSIASVPFVDQDTVYDVANLASTCAIIVFDNLEGEKRKDNTTIDIHVIREHTGEKMKLTYKYDVATIKTVKHQLLLIDSLYKLWIQKNYKNAYDVFDERFKALSNLEEYDNNFTKAATDLGEIKGYKLEGFDLVEMEIFGKKHNLVKYNTISYRTDAYSIVFYLEPNTNSKVLGIDM